MEQFVQWVPLVGAVGLVLAFLIYFNLKKLNAGTPRMQEIADQIHVGAMAFLKREYVVLFFFVVIVGGLLAAFLNPMTAVAFLSGAICSVLAGLFGMHAATKANVRTAEAARSEGQGK